MTRDYRLKTCTCIGSSHYRSIDHKAIYVRTSTHRRAYGYAGQRRQAWVNIGVICLHCHATWLDEDNSPMLKPKS